MTISTDIDTRTGRVIHIMQGILDGQGNYGPGSHEVIETAIANLHEFTPEEQREILDAVPGFEERFMS